MVCKFRLQSLEKKILIEAGETPAVVYEMKKQVDSFQEKLEVWPKCSVAVEMLLNFWEKNMELVTKLWISPLQCNAFYGSFS